MSSAGRVLDPLYGTTVLTPLVWQVARTIEMQRLREVRMCNINSLTTVGASAVNRFEHSIGTARLAIECTASWPEPFSPDAEEAVVLAGLLHDVGTAGFGHSVEYVLKEQGFAHDDLFSISAPSAETEFDYQVLDLEPLYFGRRRNLAEVLGESLLAEVSELVRGRGLYGPLISGTMDLDNVDNVYRLAYHAGLSREVEAPLTIARAMSTDEYGLVIRSDALDAVWHWYRTRARLYHHLLLNVEDFAAKCMLEVALRSARRLGRYEISWQDVDYETMRSLHSIPGEAGVTAARMMVGDLYGCLGVYAVTEEDLPLVGKPDEDVLVTYLEDWLGAHSRFSSMKLAVHLIWDVAKTERRITLRTSNGQSHTVGRDVRRLLIGVFTKARGLGLATLGRVESRNSGLSDLVLRGLRDILRTPGIEHAPFEASVSDRDA